MADEADLMLVRLKEEVQRALDTRDPATRANIFARSVQPLAGWGLRWAIQDCRDRGMPWTEIAGLLNRPYSTVLRQFQAGGPVYAHQAAHSRSTRNFDSQTPLRQAATELAKRMGSLAVAYPSSITAFYLRARIEKLAGKLTILDDPEPMLAATRVVLAAANGIKDKLSTREEMPAEERAVWTILEELDICYRRDHREIEEAHRVLSDPSMLADTH